MQKKETDLASLILMSLMAYCKKKFKEDAEFVIAKLMKYGKLNIKHLVFDNALDLSQQDSRASDKEGSIIV